MQRVRIIFALLFVLSCSQVLGQDYYKTPSGKKYHLANCRMVKNVSEKIDLQQALKLNLDPCQICMPEQPKQSLLNTNQNPRGEAKTVQCKGYTKSGTRCRHMTKIANGYCFQHNPDKK